MVDTVTICVPEMGSIASLDSLRETRDVSSGLITTYGRLGTLKVKRKSDREGLIQGSLPRWFYGSNVWTMTAADVSAAADDLATILGFNPADSYIYRLDLAATLTLPRPVAEYLSLFGPLSRAERVIYVGRGVQYRVSNRTISVYDKGREANEPGNLLRFEVQYKRKVKTQLKLASALSLADLADTSMMRMLAQRWREWYDSILKLRMPEFKLPSSVKELDIQLAQVGLKEIGLDHLLAQVDASDLARCIKTRLRTRLKERAIGGGSSVSASRIDELDAAIGAAIRYAMGMPESAT